MLLSNQPKSSLSFLSYIFADIPDAHVGTGNDRQTDGSGETLVTLGIIVLETDLELDGFEEVTLLRLERVLEELLDVGTHSGCGEKLSAIRSSWDWRYGYGEERELTDCDFRHDDSLPVELLTF
jgi:hypothetical protein